MTNDTLSTEIALLKQSQQNTMIKLNEFKETEATHHIELKELIAEMRAEIKETLDNKAGKWVEGVIKWVGIVIGSGIIGYVGSLLIKVIENL